MADQIETTTPVAIEAVTDKPVTDADLASAWENDQGATGKEGKEGIKPAETEEEKVAAEAAALEAAEKAKGEAEEQARLEAEEKARKETGEGEEGGELPDEPADNRDRSRLGRRMKSLEETLNTLVSKLEGIVKPVETTVAPEKVVYGDEYLAQQITEAKEAGIIPDIITTPEDIIATNTFVNKVNQTMQIKYAQGYLGEVKRLQIAGEVPDKLHSEIMAELQSATSPFNQRHVDNPVIDARINYAEAKAFLIEKKMAVPKSVFKGKQPDVATGVTASTRTDVVKDEMPALDEKANEFIRLTGMSPDSVKAALKEPMPFHLRGTSGTR